MDKVDAATRSRVMASVHSKNTKPEMIVRSMVHALGYRFRIHSRDLPGSPDLVFSKRRVALFVHGCFWHGHNCQHGSRKPTTNVDYWREKISRNIERDANAQAALKALGWLPMVIWECQTKDINQLSERLVSALGATG